MMSDQQQPWWKGEKGEWYVVLQFLIFAFIFATPMLFKSEPWPDPWAIIANIAGILLGAIGGLLAFTGLINLGRNLAVVPHPKDDADLVISGAYKIVRHPIYSGIILAAFGWGLLMNSLLTLLLAIGLFVFFDFKSRREEKWLARKFKEYPAYQKKVRKLVPFFY